MEMYQWNLNEFIVNHWTRRRVLLVSGGGSGEQFQVAVIQKEEAVVDSVCTHWLQLKVSCSSALWFGAREGFASPMGPWHGGARVSDKHPLTSTVVSSLVSRGFSFACVRLVLVYTQLRSLAEVAESVGCPVTPHLFLQSRVWGYRYGQNSGLSHGCWDPNCSSRLCNKHS